MQVAVPHDRAALGKYLPTFLRLVGYERWSKRVNHLDSESRKSPFRWKIVADYHWLEMAINFQNDILGREGQLRPELTDQLILAALNFVATTVEVHARLSPLGQQNLEGRLRDGLKAETGFASLYLELDLAQRLMDSGFDVIFADMEGAAQFDLLFGRGTFTGEVECKSLSVDAGRQIHRKDFYRFMEALTPALDAQRALRQPQVLVITLDARLSPNTQDQAALLASTLSMLKDGTLTFHAGDGFELERRDLNAVLPSETVSDARTFYEACCTAFGPNPHVAGGLSEAGGCLVVMRSRREDDTSKPMLEAMRKAAGQFTRRRPGFIAIQRQGIESADLMLPGLRRRAAILSYALYGHYGASHVNAIYVTGFGAVTASDGMVGEPAFGVPNPNPMFSVEPADAPLFLASISDEAYAAMIGAPLPAPDISHMPINLTKSGDTTA